MKSRIEGRVIGAPGRLSTSMITPRPTRPRIETAWLPRSLLAFLCLFGDCAKSIPHNHEAIQMKGRWKVPILTLSAATALALAATAYEAHARSGVLAIAALQEPDGQALYLKNCRKCHGATGEPSAQTRKKYKDIKSLADADFMSKVSDDSMVAVMTNGSGKDMKSWKEKLTPTEMAAVAKYVRTLTRVPNVENVPNVE
jgi:mono/diheme cytochrome c family protein